MISSYPAFYFLCVGTVPTGRSFMKNLTEGNVTKKLIAFSLPFLMSNLIQSMYGITDMLIVGWFSDSSGISAVAIGAQVTWIINSLISGITTGGTIIIAQYVGAKRKKDVEETISTMFVVFMIAAVVLTFIMFFLASPILKFINTPMESLSQAKSFIYVSLGGTFFIFGYNAVSAVLRGLGDSKSPLLFVAVACSINVVLDLILVAGLRMGPKGAAFATVTSQGIMVLAILYIHKKKIFDFKAKNFKFHKRKAKMLFRIGIPSSLQDTAVNISFIFITAIVNEFGVKASAAVGIASKFDSFAMLPATAMAMAISSMAAQNVGAGLQDRAKETMKTGIKIAATFAVLVFIFVQAFPSFVMLLFTKDAAVINAGSIYMRAFSFDFIMVSFVFCMDGFFNGCGHTNFSMANGLLSTLLVRVPLAFMLSKLFGLYGVGFAAPIASVFSIMWGLWYIKTNRWRKVKIC
jgi:putative MATE family efflux protein